MDCQSFALTVMPLSIRDGGEFTAVAIELPGCRSDGETPEEALRNGYDAIACWIEGAEEMGLAVPQPRRAAT